MAKDLKQCLKEAGITDEEFLKEILDDNFEYDVWRKKRDDKQLKLDERQRQIALERMAKKRGDDEIIAYEKSGMSTSEALNTSVGKGVADTKDLKTLSLEARYEGIKSEFLSKIHPFMTKFQTRLLGLRAPVSGMDDIVRGLFGKSLPDPHMSKMVSDLKSLFEEIRVRVNKAGGKIRHLDDWALPIEHNASRIAITKFADFDADIRKWFDFKRMGISEKVDFRDLHDVLSDRKNLDDIPDTHGRKSLVNQLSEQRIIHFKDADSYLEYNKKYGSTDIYGTIVNYVEGMASTIARMEKYGPNPDKTFDEILKTAQARAKNKAIDKARRTGKPLKDKTIGDHAKKTYDLQAGNIGVANKQMSGFMASARSVVVSSLSGRIFLTQLSDIPISSWRMLYDGLGASAALKAPIRGLYYLVKGMPREMAAQTGYISESMLGHFNRVQGRFDDSNIVNPFIRKMGEFMFRSTGVVRWTEAMQGGFALEMNLTLMKLSNKTFAELNPRLQRSLHRYGVDDKVWDMFRKSVDTHKGHKFLNPALMKDADARVRVMGMFATEARTGIPEPSARESSIFRGTESGTLAGELFRSVGSLKSFPITFANTFLHPLIKSASTKGDMAMAALFIFGILPAFGYLVSSSKQVADGKVPQDPFESVDTFRKHYGAGLLQSGGLGLFGDFLFGDSTRHGQGMAATTMGPLAGSAFGVLQIGRTLFGGGLEGDEEKVEKAAEQLLNLLFRYPGMPLSHWMINALSDKYIRNPLREMVNPAGARQRDKRVRRDIKNKQISGVYFDKNENPYE